MKRTQWLAEKIHDLDEQEYSEFRRWFLAYHAEVGREETERATQHRAVDPLIVEALAEYEATRRPD